MSDFENPSSPSPGTPIVLQNEWLMTQLIDIKKEMGEIRAEIEKSRTEIEKSRTEAADRENRILKWAIALVPVTALALLKIWDLLPIN
ncbi:MAG: hypothetical protein OXG98_16965 [Gemmatimonadetes bacterium]|nr:hypothetical protein [Gemmatimonadota bacterium]